MTEGPAVHVPASEYVRPEHWPVFDLPEDMPAKGEPYPDAVASGRVAALGVCAKCGWIHTRCRGHASKWSGAPCKKFARRGQLVCGNHGGSAPQNVKAASERLANAAAISEVSKLLAESELHLEGMTTEEQLTAAIQHAGAMALSYKRLLETLDLEADWRFTERSSENGAPQRWVDVDEHGLLGPDAKGVMQLHAYEEGFRHWTALHGRLLVEAAKLGLDERRQVLAESQVALVGDMVIALVEGLGRSLDDPAVVTVVERVLAMAGGGGETRALEATGRPVPDVLAELDTGAAGAPSLFGEDG